MQTLDVRDFVILPQGRVIHGVGAAKRLPARLKEMGVKRPFLITGRTISSQPELLEQVTASFEGLDFGVFSECLQHVPRSSVFAAAEAAREFSADVLVSFGGGTPIDTAKAVALILAEDIRGPEDLDSFSVDYSYGGDAAVPEMRGHKLPHIAVPTTVSGGEYSQGFTIKNEATGTKQVFLGNEFVPDTVVLDPLLTTPTPLWLWLATGIRSVDHAVESFLSQYHHPMTDVLALAALPALVQGLRQCKRNPDDLAARQQIQIASWMSISHVIPNVRFGLSHAMGHQIGGRYDIPHGITSCIMLPHVLMFNSPVNSERQSRLATALGHPHGGLLPEEHANLLAFSIRDLIAELDLPSSLREYEADPATFAAVAQDVMRDPMVAGNPRPISDAQQIIDLLEAAW